MAKISCKKCGTQYSRPRKSEEVNAGFPNCPNCGEPGNIYYPIDFCYKKKSLTALELLNEAAKDFIS